jgi:hypothetical protein
MSLNEISQENTQLPPEGVINATFKSLNVNGVPIGGGGGDLQSAYDNGNGVIDTVALTKPFTVQTNGTDALVVNNSNLTINQDVVVEGTSNSTVPRKFKLYLACLPFNQAHLGHHSKLLFLTGLAA